MSTTQGLGWSRDALARRAAQEIWDGAYVNLGIGIPMMIPSRIPAGREVMFHSENGILGLGGVPAPDALDLDVTNAGKEYATLVDGASTFDSSLSFAIVRGGHLDIAVLGGMQVTPAGDLANWTAPGRTPGVGGAMDLVAGSRQVWVVMEHVDRKGQSKLVDQCTLPLTGRRCIDRVFTPYGIFRPAGSHFECLELADGISPALVTESTTAPVTFAADLVGASA